MSKEPRSDLSVVEKQALHILQCNVDVTVLPAVRGNAMAILITTN
jgi:hypothetical protein